MKQGVLSIQKNLFGELFDDDIEPVRALVWKQPYAGLMLFDKVETRTWHTSYRGPVLMIAGKKEYEPEKFAKMADAVGLKEYEKRKDDPVFSLRGVAFAVGKLVGCRPLLPSDKSFVKYNPQLYAHVYQNVRRIEPIPIIGRQGFQVISDQDILRQIKYID